MILTANFKNKTITVDDYFYLFLIQNYSAEKTFTKLQLIADKNIKLKDFEFIKKQLAFANYFNIHLILQHNKYEFIKSFGIKIATNIRHDRPVLKTIPPSFSNQKINDSYINLISPPPSPPAPIIDKEHTLIIKIGKEILYINNKNISKKEFKEIIKKRALTDSFFNISYTYSNNATYQDYINTFDVFFNTIISLRKDYLKNKYNIRYNSLTNKDKEKIREVKRKFPFVFLNSTENSEHL